MQKDDILRPEHSLPTKALSDRALTRYRADGFLAPLPALSAQEADYYCRAVEAFEAETGLPAVDVIRNKGYLKLRPLYRLVFHPVVLDAVESILGPDILCWGSSLMIKEPRDPGFVAWHQDAYYWGMDPPEVVTAWIALLPSTIENGAMRAVPGSHRGPTHPHRRSQEGSHNIVFTHEEAAVEVGDADAVDLVLARGEMSLHHVNTLHGSLPNRSAQRRMGYAVTYVSTRVRQRGDRTTATLVRGRDDYGHFGVEPVPRCDMDPVCVALVDAPEGDVPWGQSE